MNYLSFSSSPLPLLLFSLFIMLGLPVSLSTPFFYNNCHDAMFKCGNISTGYPFFGGGRAEACGRRGLELSCDDYTTTTIEILSVEYQVLDIHPDPQILRIAREDLIKNGLCSPQIPIQNSILESELFDPAPGYTNVTLFYDCQPSISPISPILKLLYCNEGSTYKNVSVTIANIPPKGCLANLTVPILQTSFEGLRNSALSLEEALKTGFEVHWKEDRDRKACGKCEASGGSCGFGMKNQTICYCPFPIENWGEAKECLRLEPKGSKSKWKLNIIGLIFFVTIAIVILVTLYFCVRRFKRESSSNRNSIHLSQPKMNNTARIEAFITRFRSLALRQYVYGDIKKMTDKFRDKLGQGGYGSVYKGKLPDGRLVAVKILSESKGNGEDFMNEVASISRTSHVNIVALLGFCFERSKRALVYEFMPHGSLDKFIYNQGSHHQSRQLEWKTLYDIALGIARGLEYLHQGCNTRILHFDIKPHNILLDENFCPKISDFGLSKLCERKDSIISMTGARGTAGYIAPEVFCRNLGGVSHKSDVYSYGMMVLEMVGGRKNIDVGVSKTSEIYFPSWIYKHLDQSMNLNLDGVTAEEEEEQTKKLIVVSLWCIQTNPLDRPSMTKVLEMLQGSLQLLVPPPKPFVSSPVRSPKTSSGTSSLV